MAVDGELVALGVAAEIVVVLDDQDLRRVAMRLAVEPGRGKAADAAADHHEIVFLLDRLAGEVEFLALARQPVRHLEGAGMAAAQPGQRRRVVARGVGAKLVERRQAGSDRQCRPAQEIAPRDRRHVQPSVASVAA